MRREWTRALVVLALVAAAVWLGIRPARRTRTAAPDDEAPRYVGHEACGGCHATELAAWRGSHHARAMQAADEATVLGDFADATLVADGVTSTFSRRGGRFVVRTDGPDGALHDYDVAYTFGVSPLQQYLVAFPGGRYQALGLAWDSRPATAGGQRWLDLRPEAGIRGGDPLHWTGPAGTWNHMCAACHSTAVRKGYRAVDDAYATTWSELNVSCEACHGPGSRHVAWASGSRAGDERGAGLTVDLGNRDRGAWVMDAATGIARRRPPRRGHVEVETCAPCHARRSVVNEEWTPGRPLLDGYRPALLEPGLYHPDGQIADEVYEYGSFLQSAMYRAGVTCSDCHEPHGATLRASPDGVCATCHLPARFATRDHHLHAEGSPGASCVACHMPARTYMRVDERRDHAIRVPRPDLTVTLGTPNACAACHADRPAAWAAAELAGRFGAREARHPEHAAAFRAAEAGVAGADGRLVAVMSDAAEPAIVRATAASLLGPSLRGDAVAAVDRALRDEDPLVRSAAVSALASLEPGESVRRAQQLLADSVRVVRLDAARVLARVPADLMTREQRRAVDAGVAEYRAAELVNADRPESQLNLGVVDAAAGRLDDAAREYRRAMALAPWLAAPYVNLADVERARGHDDVGERVLRDGLRAAGEDAGLHHALGLLLVRRRRMPEALAELARATDLDPADARYAFVYAVALESTGERDHAVAVLRAARDRHPDDTDVAHALAGLDGARH